VVRICTRLEAGARLHYGKSDEPEPEVSDRGPWTLTVCEQSSVVSTHQPTRDRYPAYGPTQTEKASSIIIRSLGNNRSAVAARA
jgi:hypothetical protein